MFLFLDPLWIFHTAVRSWALWEKGNHNKLCSATSPYFPLPLSLFLYLTYISLYPCLSVLTYTVSFYSNLWLSVSVPWFLVSALLPPPPYFPVRVVMGLKDICDVIQTDCSSVSGMPLPPFLPVPTPHPPPPTAILQSPFRHTEASPLCRCVFLDLLHLCFTCWSKMSVQSVSLSQARTFWCPHLSFPELDQNISL